MPRRTRSARSQPHTRRRRRKGTRSLRSRLSRLLRRWPNRPQRQRAWRALRRAPRSFQITSALAALLLLWLLANGIYQVVRKPTELFLPVSGVLHKTPTETWRAYAPLFRKNATDALGPEFLAALAQVEGSGNPVVRTYWRWEWHTDPFEVYRPASSAVGMYQITNGTFERAKRLCIHDHAVVEDGPWNAWHSCWLNALYFRVIPSHAVELTAAFLDRAVSDTLARHRIRGASRAQKEALAAVIHLCGTGAGNAYARRGLALSAGARCGDHDPRQYLARVEAMKRIFATRAARDP